MEEKRGCTWLDGWCVERMQDKARDIITKQLKEMLKSVAVEEESTSKDFSAEFSPTKKGVLMEEEDVEEEECDEQSEGNMTRDETEEVE